MTSRSKLIGCAVLVGLATVLLFSSSITTALQLLENNGGTFAGINYVALVRDRVVSLTNTQTQKVYDLSNLRGTLAVTATCSAGTAATTVESSSDNTNWITIDSLVAAATNTKQYTETTVGASTALSPLSFRWVRITEATCGVGNTSTLTVGAK